MIQLHEHPERGWGISRWRGTSWSRLHGVEDERSSLRDGDPIAPVRKCRGAVPVRLARAVAGRPDTRGTTCTSGRPEVRTPNPEVGGSSPLAWAMRMAHGAAEVQLCRHRFLRHQGGCIPGHSPKLHQHRERRDSSPPCGAPQAPEPMGEATRDETERRRVPPLTSDWLPVLRGSLSGQGLASLPVALTSQRAPGRGRRYKFTEQGDAGPVPTGFTRQASPAGPCVVGPDKSRRFGIEAGCGSPAPVRGRRRRPHDALLWGSSPPFRAIGWPVMLPDMVHLGRVGSDRGIPEHPVEFSPRRVRSSSWLVVCQPMQRAASRGCIPVVAGVRLPLSGRGENAGSNPAGTLISRSSTGRAHQPGVRA